MLSFHARTQVDDNYERPAARGPIDSLYSLGCALAARFASVSLFCELACYLFASPSRLTFPRKCWQARVICGRFWDRSPCVKASTLTWHVPPTVTRTPRTVSASVLRTDKVISSRLRYSTLSECDGGSGQGGDYGCYGGYKTQHQRWQLRRLPNTAENVMVTAVTKLSGTGGGYGGYKTRRQKRRIRRL